MRIEEQETAKPECGRLPNDRRPTFNQCRRPVREAARERFVFRAVTDLL